MKLPQPFKNRSRSIKILAATAGAVMAGGTAFAVTNWTVNLTNGTNPAGAQSASVTNISISANTPLADGTTGGTIANLLYPGANGDVVLTISNPNSFPVSISTITTPSTQATGYSDSGLTTTVSGCSSTTSTVTWAGTAGVHTLNGGTALVVAAKSGSNNGTLVVTLTSAALMGSAPIACQNAYFSMPALSSSGTNAQSTILSATPSPAIASYS